MFKNAMRLAAGAAGFAPAAARGRRQIHRRFGAVPAAALLVTALATVAAGCVPLQPVTTTPATVEPATPVVVQPAAAPAPAPATAPVVTPAPAVAPAPVPTPVPAAAPVASAETLRALEQLTELKEELKKLLDAVEEIQFDRDREAAAMETARWQRENLFQDLDRRLLKLERDMRLIAPAPGAIAAPAAPATAPSADPAIPTLPAVQPALQPVLPLGDSAISLGAPAATAALTDAPVAGIDLAPGGPGDTAARLDGDGVAAAADAAEPAAETVVSVQEQVAYDRAFGLLKQSRYQDAIVGFQQLADTWPDGQLADDAVYWKSEAQYVNREYAAALEGFTTVTTRYPDSPRVAEALLKTGYIQYDIGAYQDAAETFRAILARFPDHQVATGAQTRLRRIEQTIQ